MDSTIDRIIDMVLEYEKEEVQKLALKEIPVKKISNKAEARLRECQKVALKLNQKLDESQVHEILFLEELASWYKTDFFKWFDSPDCTKCKKSTVIDGKRKAYIANEGDVLVEIYKCNECNLHYEFHRHNNAVTLLSKRKGNCSEWAQCFTLMCRALGWRARYVLDVTDHVWTEVLKSFNSNNKIFSGLRNKWIHIDPSEGVVDQPLLYELGWGKKLTYIFGIGCDDVQDVSWRYSMNHKEMLARRDPHFEKSLISKLMVSRNLLQKRVSNTRRQYLHRTLIQELLELMVEPKPIGDYTGRISGSEEWRLARGESSSSASYIWKPLDDETETIPNIGISAALAILKQIGYPEEKFLSMTTQQTVYEAYVLLHLMKQFRNIYKIKI